MRNTKKYLSSIMAAAMVASVALSGCSGSSDNETKAESSTAKAEEKTTEEVTASAENDSTEADTTEEATASETETETDTVIEYDPVNYIELALNVYYNDGDHNYYSNEYGQSIKLSEEGQYTVSFDCDKDLSDKATGLGVETLTNLTAVYIKDMGIASGNQSPLTECMIKYDKIVVDGTELTITQAEPKSAMKASGEFDTNDPINGWDGSCVEEIDTDTANHVANFSTVKDAKVIELTFTLSDMKWGEEETTEDPTDNPSAGDFTNTTVYSTIDFTDMTALEFTKLMGNGINLGNTMEACNRSVLGTKAKVKSYETAWGQPVTTAEMFKGMKACGFDSVRIPIAWANMMDYEHDDYTIAPELLDRIEEIVQYAIDAEMIVMINDHWDSGWWAMFGSSDADTEAKAWKIYEAIWTQVADRFKDYSDMLIFESANEELGNSLNNNSSCTTSGSLSSDELYEYTNKINQKFVDIVRNSGGNNDDRFLLIAGYNTDIDMTCDSRFQMPADTAASKLILSVHYYTPWNYCGAEKDARWGIKDDYKLMNDQFAKLTKFTDAGYGIIIGEYAALPIWENGVSSLKSNTLEFTTNLLDNCDKYNYVPMLWSCNDFFKKSTCTMITDEILKLFTSRCYAVESADADYLAKVEKNLSDNLENALDMWEDVEVVEEGTPIAWIMWNGGAGTYSVGDTYNPADNTAGAKATNPIIEGAGTYTVALEFPSANDGLTFAAIGLACGESLYPGAIIDIKEVKINGEPYELKAKPYTSSDDKKCTRVNLYNEWVGKLPKDSRSTADDLKECSPCILDKTEMVGVNSIEITFELVLAE